MKFLKHILFLILMFFRRPIKAVGGFMAAMCGFGVFLPLMGAPGGIWTGIISGAICVVFLVLMFAYDTLILLLQPEGSRIVLMD